VGFVILSGGLLEHHSGNTTFSYDNNLVEKFRFFYVVLNMS